MARRRLPEPVTTCDHSGRRERKECGWWRGLELFSSRHVTLVTWATAQHNRRTGHDQRRDLIAIMVEEGDTAVDFAIVAYLEEGRWQATSLPKRSARDLDTLVRTLRQHPGDAGALGMVSIDDDFFLLARVAGPNARLLLSDVTAASEWPIARAVLDVLELPDYDDEEDELQPAGDLGIVEDLGMSPMDLGMLCDDDELYPDQMLAEIASRLGFGSEFRGAIEMSVG